MRLPGANRSRLQESLFRGLRWPHHKKWCLCLTFDIDYHEDEKQVEQLLELLARRGWRASFCCIAQMAQQRSDLYRTIAQQGHEIVNHSLSHPYHKELASHACWSELGLAEITKQIAQAHQILEHQLGVHPVGFRSPHFEFSHHTATVLRQLGYLYNSSGLWAEHELCASLPVFAHRILHLPLYRSVSTWRVRTGELPLGEFLSTLRGLLATEARRGGPVVLMFDPRDIKVIKSAFKLITESPQISQAWVCPMASLARYLLHGKVEHQRGD